MPSEISLANHIKIIFDLLIRGGRADILASPGSLASRLNVIVDEAESEEEPVTPREIRMFATAAVEMWLRGIHSFLISAASTRVSPVWASISGYYASHYTIRAFAHLLGYFQLYRRLFY